MKVDLFELVWDERTLLDVYSRLISRYSDSVDLETWHKLLALYNEVRDRAPELKEDYRVLFNALIEDEGFTVEGPDSFHVARILLKGIITDVALEDINRVLGRDTE